MIGTIVLVLAGVFLLFGAGLPGDSMLLPGIFGGSPRSWIPLHAPTARFAGLACFGLLYLLRRGGDPLLLIVVAALLFILLVLSMVLGLNESLRR